MFATYNPISQEVILMFSEKKRQKKRSNFFFLVRNIYKGNYPIHFILDNWSVHKTKVFKETAQLLNI